MSRRRRRQRRMKRGLNRHTRSWYRLPEEGKIAGVCAGLAEHYEISNLMARGIAVTGAVFMPQIVIVAYIVAIFLLPTREELRQKSSVESASILDEVETRKGRRARRRQRMDEALDDTDDADYEQTLGARRMMVKRYKERMGALDQRLQNLENHVTSRRYDLSQEIDSL